MGTIKTTNIETITGSGTLTLGTSGETITIPSGVTMTNNGVMSGQNYPAFEAILSSTQSVSDATHTKVQINSEIYDTNSCYDNVTNYRFTPNVAGKYYVYGQVALNEGGSYNFNLGVVSIRKNGSTILTGQLDHRGNPTGILSIVVCFGVIDMNGSTDYLELFGYIDGITAGSESFTGAAVDRYTSFGAYRIGS